MCIEHFQETVVELSIDDVTSGLARPLAAEIAKSPLFDSRRKPHITRERLTIDRKHVLNADRKSMVTQSSDDFTSVSDAS
jgi:hypothetical protein